MDVSYRLKIQYLSQYPAEASNYLNASSNEEILALIQTASIHAIKKALSLLTIERLVDVSKSLQLDYLTTILQEVKPEKVARVLGCLDDNRANEVLDALPNSLKLDLLEIMNYPSGTAGSMMDPHILTFDRGMSSKQAVDKIKIKDKRSIRFLYLVNDLDELDSMVSIQDLVLADDTLLLGAISQPIPCILKDMTQQDEIVAKLEEHKLTEVPVVDNNNHFIGIVRHHSIVQATKEVLTKDIQAMVGVSRDETANSNVLFAVRKRLPWLEVNLLTAFLAAAVVGLFESTIAQFTALAVLLPVVAGQSGNTGAQALAVTMRGLALKEVRLSQWLILIIKESRIAAITGVAVAIPTSIAVYFWSGSLGLMFIIFISMVLSMIIAGISGAAVPIVLVKLKQDPASASSIILTTVTDVCGFFSFLGIATAFSNFI